MANVVRTVQIRADTSQARASIQDLQTQLASLQSVPITADVTGLQTARNEINQLSQSLRSAINPTSGKLDLSVFSQQLMKSGKTLNDYKNALFSMGTQGQQAFLSLANTIASAEAPTNRLNAKVLQFGKTLKNTINWQLSSTLIHGVVGQVNQAISYAEKLNASLNNIQIVTGQNNERMVEFARQANKTAKELNSTTTEYTNAALIYYQQGLSDKEVAARNAVTLKMANVTRQSAQTVSDQLTAIWNNFDDGTASLEHYADVITALGAATASSSTEISTGLDKFASIGKTVGLSYDYATTALATIVATTRQSAESVGTGLRTIFSRLQGLNLGETLDDGVTLNKYSDALAKVGVNILDQYNNVKSINTILDELGSKWQTISKEQQVALAQTVGGVRQYTTIMTLMNNWSTFQENLKVAQGADGTLQTQADRYATSWEAARKKVQTATEGIYDSLIDDQGIIGATNAFAGFLDVINGLVEGFGGLKNIIPMIFALFASSAARNVPQFLGDIKANFLAITGIGTKNMLNQQSLLNKELQQMYDASNDDIYKLNLTKTMQKNTMNQKLAQKSRFMSDADQEAYRQQMYLREMQTENIIQMRTRQQALEKDYSNVVSKIRGPASGIGKEKEAQIQGQLEEKINNINTDVDRMLNDSIEQIENNRDKKISQLQESSQLKERLIRKGIESRSNGSVKTDSDISSNEYLKKKETELNKNKDQQLEEIQKEIDSANAELKSAQKSASARKGVLTQAEKELANARRALANRKNAKKYKDLSQEEEFNSKQSQRLDITEKERLDYRKKANAARKQMDILTVPFDKDVKEAEDKVKEEQKKYDSANARIEQAQTKLDNANKKYTRTKEKLEADIDQQMLDEIERLDKEKDKRLKEEEKARLKEVEENRREAEDNIDKETAADIEKEKTNAEQMRLAAEEEAKLEAEKQRQQAIQAKNNTLIDLYKQGGGVVENLSKEYQKLINGGDGKTPQALTEENLIALRGGKDKLTGNDILALRQANEFYTNPLKQAAIRTGELQTASKNVQSFMDQLGEMDSTDVEAIQKRASEYAKQLKMTFSKMGASEADKISLDDIINSNPDQIKGIFDNIRKALSQDTSNALEEQQSIDTELAKNGFSGTDLAKIIAQAYGIGEGKFNEDMTPEPGDVEEPPTNEKSVSVVATNMTAALTTMITSVNTASSSLETIFDDSATGAEKLGAAFSGVTSLVMAFAMATKFATTVTTEKAQTDFLEGTSKFGKFGTTRIGQALGLGGTWGSIATIAVLGVSILKSLQDNRLAKEEEQWQNAVNAGNETYDKLTSSSTLIQSQSNLINAYNAAAKAIAEGTATEKELMNARQELITSLMKKTDDGYTNSNAVAYAYAGNMKGVQSQIDANRLLQIQQSRVALEDRSVKQGKKLQTAAEKTTSIVIPTNTQERSIWEGITGENYSENPLASFYAGYSFESPEKIYSRYQQLIQIRDEYLRQELSTSDNYKKIVSTIITLQESAEDYGKYRDQIEALDIEALALGETLDGHYINNANLAIKDIKSYNDYRQDLIKAEQQRTGYFDEDSEDYKDMVKAVDAYLGTVSAVTGNELGNLQYISTGIENVIEAQKKMGLKEDDESSLRESLINAYAQAGDALFSIGTIYKLPITFDVNSLDNDLQNVIDLLNLQAEENKIKLQIDLADNFNLDEKSTSEEWAKFVKDLNKDIWKDVFGEDFDLASFTALTNDEREIQMFQYLGRLKSMYYSSGGGADKKLEGLASQREALQTELTELLISNSQDILKSYGLDRETMDSFLEMSDLGMSDIISTELQNRENLESYTIPSVLTKAIEAINNATTEEEKTAATQEYARIADLMDIVGRMTTEELQNSSNFNNSDISAKIMELKSLLNGETFEDIDKLSEAIEAIEDEDQKKRAQELLTQIGATEEAEASLQAEQEAYQATGFRDILQKEAELYGIDYSEVQKYAEALRETESWQQSFVKGQEDIIESSEAVALAILEAEAAITSISEKYSDWNDIVSSSQTSTMKKNAVYGEMAKSLRKLLVPTGTVTKGFAKLADNMGLVYSAGQNDKAAILDLGKGLMAYSVIGEKTADDIINNIKDESEAWETIQKTATETLQKYYDSTESAVTAKEDLATISNFLAEAEEGQIFSTEANAAAQRAYTAELKNFIATNPGATIAEGMQAASDAMDAATISMPTPTLVPITAEQYASGAYEGAIAVPQPDGTTWDVADGNTVETESTGSSTYYYLDWSGKNAAAQTPNGGKSGGGGGGGGKKKKDHKKPDTGTRYHKIRAQQANNNQRQQETNRQKERAFGAEKIKQAQEEIVLQKEQIRLQREYVDEITDYLGDDRKQMEDSFKGLGISLNIDSDGVITNFRAVEEELLRQENSLIDQYNDGPLDDEAYAEAQKKIDDAREYLKIYEETRDLYEEQMIAMIEQMDDLADKLLELTKTKVELKIDISDDKIELLDYMLEKIEDDAYKVAEAIALIGDKTSENLERIDIYRSGLQEILGAKGFTLEDLNNLTDEELMSANFTQAEIDQIKDWRSELYDLNKELLETRETIIDKVVDAFDELNERVQDSYDKFDNYNSILENYKNITELMSIRLNQQNKELLDSLGRAAIANAQQQASAAFNIYNEAQGRLEQATSIYNDIVDRYGPNSQEEQQYRKILEAAEEDFEEAQEEWLEAHENALKTVEEHYTATIERISKEFEQAIAGLFGTLDYLQSAFERAGTVNDEYLQDYERLYELSKLNRDIQKDIDDTNNIRSKQALRNLQAEINKLQEEGVKLSQYDIDALRKKYELEQARQALEDARNTKSEVRLQRDANGNWGYVYTNAEDEVDDAEQEYENRLYEYQKLNDEYIEELQERALEIQQTYQEVLGEIFAPDSGLTEEERQARLDEINAWRDSELTYIQSQLENAMTNQNDLLDIYYQTYGKNWAEVADTWDETRLRMLSGFETLDNFLKNTIDAMNQLQKNYQEAIIQYQKDEEETQIAAGQSTEKWADLVGIAIGNIGTNSKKTKEEIEALSAELTDNFLISLQSVITWEQEYADKIDGATEANERFIQSLNDMIAKLSVLESSNPEVKAARAAYVAAEAAHEAFIQSHGAGANDPNWEKAKSNWNDFITKYLAKFDTGGYTGSWGTEGRLAVLHEKENVFSAADTANLLDAAQILRTIDLSARSFAAGLGNIILPDFQPQKESLQQEVHIEASFPSVQDHNEIELAFDNLINKASQYANRKNMSSMTFQDMYTSKF